MKYLAACSVIVGCIMLANPAFAGDTRITIHTDLGLFGNSYSHYDRHYGRHYDRHHDRRTVIVHRAPRVFYSPFSGHHHGFWHDNGRRGYDKHWKHNDRRHDNRRDRDDHRDRRDRDRRH